MPLRQQVPYRQLDLGVQVPELCSWWTRPWATRCPGCGGHAQGSGVGCLPDRLSSDLSHDGALTPQVLEAEAQKAVNDEGCRAKGGRRAAVSLGIHVGTRLHGGSPTPTSGPHLVSWRTS